MNTYYVGITVTFNCFKQLITCDWYNSPENQENTHLYIK